MVDGRPREPVGRQPDRRRGEPVEAQPPARGERDVAGRRRRRADRRRPGVAPRAGGRHRRRGPAARRRSPAAPRASGPGAQDDGDEVAAEAALRRQQHRLGERRGHRRVEGVAAVAHRRGAGLGGQRRGGAHDPAAAAAGALLGHHRSRSSHVSRPAAQRRSPSSCARASPTGTPRHEREVGVHAEPRRRPATSRRSTTVARPGPANAVPSSRVPTESHGTTATAWQPSGEAITTSSSTRKRTPSIAGQTLRHCCVLELVEAVDDLGVRAEGDDVGAKRRAGRRHVDGGDLGAPRGDPLAHRVDSIGSASGGSCILGRESIQYTRWR